MASLGGEHGWVPRLAHSYHPPRVSLGLEWGSGRSLWLEIPHTPAKL